MPSMRSNQGGASREAKRQARIGRMPSAYLRGNGVCIACHGVDEIVIHFRTGAGWKAATLGLTAEPLADFIRALACRYREISRQLNEDIAEAARELRDAEL